MASISPKNASLRSSMFLIFFLLLPLSFLSAVKKELTIITTVFPLMEFSEAVSGGRGETFLLIPPGAEIHTWEPRPSDIVRLSSADLFIYIGADLEPWALDMLKSTKNPDLKVLEASKGLVLLEESHSGDDKDHSVSHTKHDPHIWLDFDYDQSILLRIAAMLSEIDPDGVDEYDRNASVYNERLKELDNDYKRTLGKCKKRELFIGGHAAFGYLAKRYGLQQISLSGLSPDAAPTPRRMIEMIELARKKKIKVIFFESQVSVKLAKVLAEEIQAETMVLNPGVNISLEEKSEKITFIDIMKNNLKRLKDALSCF